MTPRTQEKIKENLGLLMDFFAKKYGSADEEVEYMLANALTWTADDVARQCAFPSCPISSPVAGCWDGTLPENVPPEFPRLARIRQWFRYRVALRREVSWITRCDLLGDVLMGYGCRLTHDSWRQMKIAEAKIRLRKEFSL